MYVTDDIHEIRIPGALSQKSMKESAETCMDCPLEAI